MGHQKTPKLDSKKGSFVNDQVFEDDDKDLNTFDKFTGKLNSEFIVPNTVLKILDHFTILSNKKENNSPTIQKLKSYKKQRKQ